MPPPNSSRRPPLYLSSPKTRHSHLEPAPERHYYSSPRRMTPALAPLFIPSSSLMHIPQAPSSPPFTPPALIPSLFCDAETDSFPCTPSTPIFSPTSEGDAMDPLDVSYARKSHLNTPESPGFDPRSLRTDIISAPLISPTSSQVRHVASRPQLAAPVSEYIEPQRRPNLVHYSQSNRTLTPATSNVATANVYSEHFPPAHVLDVNFSRLYAPGSEIGGGAFGFVVTATHRLTGHEVAVKFIERRKVPSWGWCNDPELGHVPIEAMLLKTLDHPGIINFLDLFRDEAYFYLVQELHGSPWQRKLSVHSDGDGQKAPSTSITFSSTPSIQNPSLSVSELVQTAGQSHHQKILDSSSYVASCQLEPTEFPFPHLPIPFSPFPPPQISSRPTMNRRFSHDLFECIEEHRRLSESQACYVFAQVVDVIHYLHTIGVAHRDIKDENILVDRAFRVKVIDFGSASCANPNRHGPRPWYRHFRGTIAYAPAEVFRGVTMHQAEPADVWALGILLSCLICGRRPFATTADAAEGRFTLHRCKVRAEGEPPSQTREMNTVSEGCWNLLKRCLDPDPNTRANITEVQGHPWLKSALGPA